MKQKITYEQHGWEELPIVKCPVCGEKISLNRTCKAVPTLAWFDPHNKQQQTYATCKGCYVCMGCLSEERAKEIEKTRLTEKLFCESLWKK